MREGGLDAMLDEVWERGRYGWGYGVRRPGGIG
jgi:hypothetical protein